jgi:hypothetical protein
VALPTRCPPFSTYQRRRRRARRHRASSEPFGPQLARPPRGVAEPNQGGDFSLSLMVERQRYRFRRNVHHLPIHPLHHSPNSLQGYSSIRMRLPLPGGLGATQRRRDKTERPRGSGESKRSMQRQRSTSRSPIRLIGQPMQPLRISKRRGMTSSSSQWSGAPDLFPRCSLIRVR